MDLPSYLALLGFLAVILVPLISGRVFRPNPWYRQLAKPGWKPPDWLFGPVWTVLFGTIAFSGWLIWVGAGYLSSSQPALIAYFSSSRACCSPRRRACSAAAASTGSRRCWRGSITATSSCWCSPR